MKKRIGFVSNSSSASFCIIGYEYSYDQREEVLQRVAPEKLAALQEKYPDRADENKDKWGYEDELYDLLNKYDTFGDDISYLSNDGSFLIGQQIAVFEDWGCSKGADLSTEDFVKVAEQVQKAVNETTAARLHIGERAC
jgi:hypothetical protein